MSSGAKKMPARSVTARYRETQELDAKVRALAERGVPFDTDAYRLAMQEAKR